MLSLKHRACRPRAVNVSSGTCIPEQLGVYIANSMTSSKIPVAVFAATSLECIGHCYCCRWCFMNASTHALG